MTRAVLATLIMVLLRGAAHGQDVLPLDKTIERELEAGVSHSYTITLAAGDYVAGSVDQRGIVVVTAVYLPDGSLLRTFPGPPEGALTFAFIADAAGTYRLEVRPQTAEEAAETGGDLPSKGSYVLKVAEKLSLEERLKPRPPKDRYVSTAIEALRKQVADGDTSSQPFWRQAAQSGTPLVEPMDKDPARTLVTFLWRGTADTRNVAVLGSFITGPRTDYVMSHLAGTDVWYLTVRLPAGSRFAYRLSPNDSLVFDISRATERMATAQADPLNPNRWNCPPTATRHECWSLVELPGAPPQPWIVRNPGTPVGKIDSHQFTSAILTNERNLSVYTPPGYSPNGRPHALLVLFDEEAYLESPVPTPVILDNLIAASKIPPTVAVLISNVSREARGKELPPNPPFADFLAKELIPWVRTQYNVTTDPRLTVIGGSSYGGIAAMYAGLRHSAIFGNVLCQSGSFWWAPDRDVPPIDAMTETGWLAKEFIKSPRLPLELWMDAGVFEVDAQGTGGGILEGSRHMRDVLLAKGYTVHYRQFNSGHDYLNWRGTLADGLIALIGDDASRSSSR